MKNERQEKKKVEGQINEKMIVRKIDINEVWKNHFG